MGSAITDTLEGVCRESSYLSSCPQHARASNEIFSYQKTWTRGGEEQCRVSL